MPTVKIHELPTKNSDAVLDTDIMVIEDGQDTKQISIRDLKLILDSKQTLESIKNSIEKEMNDLTDNVEKSVKEINKIAESLRTEFSDTSEEISRINKTLESIQKNYSDIADTVEKLETFRSSVEKSIEDINKVLTNHTNTISDISKQTTSNAKDLKSLKNTVDTQQKSINDNIHNIEELQSSLSSEVERLEELLQNVDDSEREYAEKLYDDVMKYIDYYHHIHENPPNFDEPYQGDPVIADYINPIGSIYQTTDKDFVYSKQFPGTWVYCGVAHAIDDNNNSIEYYTFKRIS